MTGKLTISRKFHIAREGLGRKRFREGEEAATPTGRVQRVSRVMALAIQCDQLIRDGVIKNQSELAHYAQVTTARMTHIMWLTNLAPEIQEAILFLPRVESGPDTVKEIEVRRIARMKNWGVQRGLWDVCRLDSGFLHDHFSLSIRPTCRDRASRQDSSKGGKVTRVDPILSS